MDNKVKEDRKSLTRSKSVLNLALEDTFDLEDLENRKLFINGEIDEFIIESIVYWIMRYNSEDKGKPIEDRLPIKLYINSPGGSFSDGYGLIDAILTSKTPVWTINLATCASMGFLIFIAGNKRYSMPHAEFLMHDGSTGYFGSSAKVADRVTFEKDELEAMNKQYVVSKTQISEQLYDEKYRIEWYFLPSAAKEVGVVDYIVGQDCDMDEII